VALYFEASPRHLTDKRAMTSPSDLLNALGSLKNALRDRLPEVKSSHLSEAVAAAFGFRTHASLLAYLKEGGELTFVRFDALCLITRLEQLGYEGQLDVAHDALSGSRVQ
jgi:hypothetical protein